MPKINQDAVDLACFIAQDRQYPAREVAQAATLIYRRAKTIDTLAIAACNYELSSRQKTRLRHVRREVEQIASQFGMKAETHRDPRGAPVVLRAKWLPDNTMGGGWAVVP